MSQHVDSKWPVYTAENLIYFPFKDAMRKKEGIKRDKRKKTVNRNRKDEYKENKEKHKKTHPL